MDTADISLIVAICAFVVQILGVVVAGVWVVAKIGGATAMLRQAIGALKESIDHLRSWLQIVDERTDGHAERIARMEEQIKRRGGAS